MFRNVFITISTPKDLKNCDEHEEHEKLEVVVEHDVDVLAMALDKVC